MSSPSLKKIYKHPVLSHTLYSYVYWYCMFVYTLMRLLYVRTYFDGNRRDFFYEHTAAVHSREVWVQRRRKENDDNNFVCVLFSSITTTITIDETHSHSCTSVVSRSQPQQ